MDHDDLKCLYEYLQECDTIDVAQIQADIMARKNQKFLEMHKGKVYQGSDGGWYTYMPLIDGKRKKVRRNKKEDLVKYLIDYYKDSVENPTVNEVFKEWNNLRLERKKIARSTYDKNISIFKRHFGTFGRRKITNLTPEDVQDFLESEIARLDLTAKSFNNLKGIMIGILKMAKRKKLIDMNISDLIDTLDVSDRDFAKRIKEDYEEVFNEEETQMVMQYCMSNLDSRNLGILLMFVTGMRVGEVVALKHDDIQDNYIKIRRTETRYSDVNIPKKLVYTVKDFPKTKAGVRDVVVPKDYHFLLDMMKLMNPNGEYIFTQKDGTRFHTMSFRGRLYRICNRLKIPRRSPHKIRKTVGTIYMDEKLDNNLIQRQMGWASMTTGENHYHRNRKTMNKRLDIVSNIPEFQLNA